MTGNKTLRIWQLAVVLLAICNLALMVTIWLKPGIPQGLPRETPRDFVIRNLKFNDAQVKSYDVLIEGHQQAMKRLRKQAMEYRQLLFSGYKNAGINTDSLAQLIASTQREIEIVTYAHFGAVRALCTDVQKTEFDDIIGDVMKKMNGGPPPPHGHMHGPPPGDREGPPHPAHMTTSKQNSYP